MAMNTGDCLYIYRQLADGNGRGNCKLLCIAKNCYIQLADTAGKKSNRKLYIYGICQLAGRYPRRPSQPGPEPTWGVPDRLYPPIAAGDAEPGRAGIWHFAFV